VNSLGETFDRIDLDTGQVTQGVATTGNAPNDLWVDAARDRAWVANSMDNAVTAYDLATLAPVAACGWAQQQPWNWRLRRTGACSSRTGWSATRNRRRGRQLPSASRGHAGGHPGRLQRHVPARHSRQL
jgi:hypothetical protein